PLPSVPLTHDGDLRAQLVARRAQFFVDVAVARVELRRDLVLDERLIELAGRREPPAAEEVILRRAQARAIEPEPRVRVVGMLADGFRVLDDGAVVVLPALGVAAVAQRGRRDAPGCGEAE